jgi:hypothetical protein
MNTIDIDSTTAEKELEIFICMFFHTYKVKYAYIGESKEIKRIECKKDYCKSNRPYKHSECQFIKYKLEKINSLDSLNFDHLKEGLNDATFKKIKKMLRKKIFPINIEENKELKITLVNNDGFNYDHRGADHTIVPLPFYERYTLTKNTYNSFVHSLFRIKSKKFDNNYELYIGCKIKKINKNEIEIHVEFDHGS